MLNYNVAHHRQGQERGVSLRYATFLSEAGLFSPSPPCFEILTAARVLFSHFLLQAHSFHANYAVHDDWKDPCKTSHAKLAKPPFASRSCLSNDENLLLQVAFRSFHTSGMQKQSGMTHQTSKYASYCAFFLKSDLVSCPQLYELVLSPRSPRIRLIDAIVSTEQPHRLEGIHFLRSNELGFAIGTKFVPSCSYSLSSFALTYEMLCAHSHWWCR